MNSVIKIACENLVHGLTDGSITTAGGSITLSGLLASTFYDISYDDGSGTVNLGSVTTDGAGKNRDLRSF